MGAVPLAGTRRFITVNDLYSNIYWQNYACSALTGKELR